MDVNGPEWRDLGTSLTVIAQMSRNGHSSRWARGFARLAFVVAAAIACAFAALTSTALAVPAQDDATVAYVEQVQPAYAKFGKVAEDVDKAIAKAERRSDRDNASRFAALAKRVRAANVKLGRIEPPKAFARPHGALVRAITRLGKDLDLVAAAARKKDKTVATEAGFRLGRTVKALKKAEKALDLALSRVAAPGDAASL